MCCDHFQFSLFFFNRHKIQKEKKVLVLMDQVLPKYIILCSTEDRKS